MKFKQQEENQSNPFLKSIGDLMSVNLAFSYAIESNKKYKDCVKFRDRYLALKRDFEFLSKLYINLNSKHITASISPELNPSESNKDLITLEEKYYNMLKEIGNNALESNNIEVTTYISHILFDFEHYFCTLDESDISGETSS